MNLKELIEYARDHNIIEYGNYVDLMNRVDELYEAEDRIEELEYEIEVKQETIDSLEEGKGE